MVPYETIVSMVCLWTNCSFLANCKHSWIQATMYKFSLVFFCFISKPRMLEVCIQYLTPPQHVARKMLKALLNIKQTSGNIHLLGKNKQNFVFFNKFSAGRKLERWSGTSSFRGPAPTCWLTSTCTHPVPGYLITSSGHLYSPNFVFI